MNVYYQRLGIYLFSVIMDSLRLFNPSPITYSCLNYQFLHRLLMIVIVKWNILRGPACQQ